MVDSRREKYEQEAQSLKEGYEKGTITFWGPKVGKNIIRILPPKNREEDADAVFFTKIKVHWGVGPGKKRTTCRKTVDPNQSCPACEYSDELIASGRKEDVIAGRNLSANEKYVMCVVDVQDTSKGVQIFEASRTLFNDILQLFLDEDYGDIDSLETGRHVKIERVGTGKFDTKYTVIPAGNPTRVDSRIMEKVLDLTALYQIPTLEEVEATLKGEEIASPEEKKEAEDVKAMLETPEVKTETPKEEDVKEAPKEEVKEAPKEETKEAPKEEVKEAPKEAPKEEAKEESEPPETKPEENVGDMLEIPVGDGEEKATPPASRSRADQLATMREELKKGDK